MHRRGRGGAGRSRSCLRGYLSVNRSASAMTAMPKLMSSTWAALVRGSARRCSPGMRPATAM